MHLTAYDLARDKPAYLAQFFVQKPKRKPGKRTTFTPEQIRIVNEMTQAGKKRSEIGLAVNLKPKQVDHCRALIRRKERENLVR